jgi:hypothetical protein
MSGTSVTSLTNTSTSGGNGFAVLAEDSNAAGVSGTNPSGVGVSGSGEPGVLGQGTTSYGVEGRTDSGQAAVAGFYTGNSGSSAAVLGSSEFQGVGVKGISQGGYGLLGAGGLAPLALGLAFSAGAPTVGSHQLGEVYVDSAGVFYKCAVAGTPGTWVPLYSVVPLATPVRVLNTTNGTGGLSGPFAPDGTTHTTSVLTGGATGIPPKAVGVVANLAISGNGALLNGVGFLTLFPAGTANPDTASLNATGGDFATSNGVTIAFGTGANAGKLSFSWQGGGNPLPCQVFLDVTAYIL